MDESRLLSELISKSPSRKHPGVPELWLFSTGCQMLEDRMTKSIAPSARLHQLRLPSISALILTNGTAKAESEL